ncbi:hypothetical protein NQ314_013780 [Rhamnusium bicolor]|uniref:Uncharacterized protein n=1 Tax=Rhamnusium bicolor TaxID=1586634 RepID=A0AAV8X5V5_9CUCU|nr:hypothetical protein NQ314_013780 [Rhamnusium bicolor]
MIKVNPCHPYTASYQTSEVLAQRRERCYKWWHNQSCYMARQFGGRQLISRSTKTCWKVHNGKS